jgi:DNA-binding transcriptional LysR family regulator
MELPSVTMIKLFVGANLGVSLISEGFTKDDVRAGRVKLIPIKDVELWRELGLIYRRDRHLPRSASAFADLIRGADGKSDGKSEAKPESKDGKPEEGI